MSRVKNFLLYTSYSKCRQWKNINSTVASTVLIQIFMWQDISLKRFLRFENPAAKRFLHFENPTAKKFLSLEVLVSCRIQTQATCKKVKEVASLRARKVLACALFLGSSDSVL